MTSLSMDNTGKVPLRIPGFNDVPLDYELSLEARFTHGIDEYVQTPAVTARELDMIAAMNDITDKDDWRSMTAEQLAQWETEMMAKHSLLSKRTWEWCVSELKDKALVSEHFTRVLEAGSCVCKSDQLPATLAQALQRTSDVDPSMYPLVYGRTSVLQNGSVDLHDLYANASHSVRSVLSTDLNPSFDAYVRTANVVNDGVQWYSGEDLSTEQARELRWSARFQALPCEVELTDRVRITSYVNNLPPGPVYGVLEEIIALSIGMWDECLMKGRTPKRSERDQEQRGYLPLRIVTFGVEWHGTLPSFARAFSEDHKSEIKLWGSGKTSLRRLQNVPPIPELNEDLWRQAEAYLAPVPRGWREQVWQLLKAKAASQRYWTHPEPVVTYDEWKAGRNVDRAVVKMISQPHYSELLPAAGPAHDKLNTRLRDYNSLQLIAKITSGSSSWRVTGHLNEHIAASAVYVFEGSGSISFRQETYMTDEVYRSRGARPVMDKSETYEYDSRYYGEDTEAFAAIYGFEESALLHDTSTQYLPMQDLGIVQLPLGRMVTFPNTVDYKIKAHEGSHLRFVMFHLVDPNYRICSTRNVPPQQESWLRDARLTESMVEQLKRTDKVLEQSEAEAYREQMMLEQEWITGARHGAMPRFGF